MICLTVGFGGPEGSAAASPDSGFFPPGPEEPPWPPPFLGLVSLVEFVKTMKSSLGCVVAVFLPALDEDDFFDDDVDALAATAAEGAAVAFSLPFLPMIIIHLAT